MTAFSVDTLSLGDCVPDHLRAVHAIDSLHRYYMYNNRGVTLTRLRGCERR